MEPRHSSCPLQHRPSVWFHPQEHASDGSCKYPSSTGKQCHLYEGLCDGVIVEHVLQTVWLTLDPERTAKFHIASSRDAVRDCLTGSDNRQRYLSASSGTGRAPGCSLLVKKSFQDPNPQYFLSLLSIS